MQRTDSGDNKRRIGYNRHTRIIRSGIQLAQVGFSLYVMDTTYRFQCQFQPDNEHPGCLQVQADSHLRMRHSGYYNSRCHSVLYNTCCRRNRWQRCLPGRSDNDQQHHGSIDRHSCLLRTNLQLEKSSGPRFFIMDKPYRFRRDIHRNPGNSRYIQVPAPCIFRLRFHRFNNNRHRCLFHHP